jgi:hypothetical protein
MEVSCYRQMQDEMNDVAPASDEQADGLRVEGWLTRKHVAEQLGVSIFKVRSMEGKDLHPEVMGGVHYFDPEEVAPLAWSLVGKRGKATRQNDEGEIAALVFVAFDEGRDLFEIVTRLRIPPERVRALYREWREPDLEQHEIARRKRERLRDQRQREQAEQRLHEKEMKRMDRDLARLARMPKL